MEDKIVVIYRKGTPDKFKWNVVFQLFESIADAEVRISSLQVAGYFAIWMYKDSYTKKGVPDTYEGAWI